MGKIFLGLAVFVLFLVSFSLLTTPAFACHDPTRPLADNIPPPLAVVGGVTITAGPCPGGLTQIEDLVKQVISIAVGLAFLALVVMLFIGGLKYLLSGGETKALNSATQTITWALLGILFLAIAWLILKLIEAFTGIPLTRFNIKVL